MKKFEITKEQILELVENNANSKGTLQHWFPQAFESELEVGKWYKNKYNSLFYVSEFNDDVYKTYGFKNGKWISDVNTDKNSDFSSDVLATEEEVKTALIKEAEKRGFKKGTIIKECLEGGDFDAKINGKQFEVSCNSLWIDSYTNGKNVCIFKEGKWAEITSEPLTIEQRLERIEKKLEL